MATQEDFSFPTTTDTPPRFIESPRLWRTTSLVSSSIHESTPKGENEEEDFNLLYQASSDKLNYMHQRKSFSLVECVGTKKRSTGDGDEDYGKYESDHGDYMEEKMDMLWEDLNEEFSRNSKSSSSSSPSRDVSDNFHRNPHHMSHGQMLNFGCVHSLKLSKPNKRPRIVVFMKVLKKMLMLQNSHRTVKKSQW